MLPRFIFVPVNQETAVIFSTKGPVAPESCNGDGLPIFLQRDPLILDSAPFPKALVVNFFGHRILLRPLFTRKYFSS